MKSRNDFTKDNEGEKQYQEYLRTYFAAMAMQGILAGFYTKFGESLKGQLKAWEEENPGKNVAENVSIHATAFADALLSHLTNQA